MDSLLLPDDAIVILRRAVWQPDAKRSHELMTGSFWWSDELVGEVARLCVGKDNWSFRYLMGYRASVIRGAPNVAFRPVWEQVAQECPDWPGLRPERNSQALAVELHREGRRQCVEFMRWERQLRAKSPKDEPSVAADGNASS